MRALALLVRLCARVLVARWRQPQLPRGTRASRARARVKNWRGADARAAMNGNTGTTERSATDTNRYEYDYDVGM